MDGQTTIFDMLYPKYKITTPIRIIELFGGYGSQLMALKRLNANVEQWKLCEWAVKSIQAYILFILCIPSQQLKYLHTC